MLQGGNRVKRHRATAWKNDDVIRILQRHGFVTSRKTKHIFLTRPGNPGFVKVSLSDTKYLSLNAFCEMRRTSGLSRDEFNRLFGKI
jgi:hypothetical protein